MSSELQLLTARDFYRVRTLKNLASFTLLGEIQVNIMNDVEGDYNKSNWEEHRLLTRVQQLNLPNELVSHLKELINPIVHNILEWFIQAADCFGFSESNVAPFIAKHGLHWKWCGIVDYEQMARAIVGDDEISVLSRFSIACDYCFVADIYQLWELMSDSEINDHAVYQHNIDYWRMKLNGSLSSVLEENNHDEVDFGMSQAIESGNVSAIRYFWDRMDGNAQNDSIVRYASQALSITVSEFDGFPYQPHIVPFFVLKMNRGQQMQVLNPTSLSTDLNSIPTLILWPWTDIFLPVLEAFVISSPTTEIGFQTAVLNILNAMSAYNLITVFNLPGLNSDIILRLLTLLDSDRRKLFFGGDLCCLWSLFETRLTRCLDLILSELNAVELQEIAVSEKFLDRCHDMILGGEFDAMKCALPYMLPCDRDEIRLFKERVADHFRSSKRYSYVDKLVDFLHFMDEYCNRLPDMVRIISG